ncbi:MAG: hypothetical protein V7629_06675 [Motiliproteus sp.]
MLRDQLHPRMSVLIKGSLFMAMDKIVGAIVSDSSKEYPAVAAG